jgi:LmbE family N-acetylglucosaminyl deacetylase
VKDPGNVDVCADLTTIFSRCRPQVVYLHNPADKHDTHVAVLLRTLEALRALPADSRPNKVLGCEVWRDLDWLSDNEKQILDTSSRPNLAAALLAVYDSQISGGKRYDLAAVARRVANATFLASHVTDASTALNWALDLTPLVADPGLSVEALTLGAIDRFRADVQKRLRQLG